MGLLASQHRSIDIEVMMSMQRIPGGAYVTSPGLEWWREAVIYHIYPRSFQDSNGDGIGDLPGITARLDYLQELGIDAIWLSPVFPSPMRDFGYDIADYCDIDPMFGTLEDFDAMLADAHARGIRVLIDFVLNHTSDQHPWFVRSRSSREAATRDWYIWRAAAADGGPPDDMRAVFGGSAWQLDATTGEYYLHSFLPEQPDLNWQNPEVVRAMTDALRFWLRRGVDGVRLDAVAKLVKHTQEASDGPLDATRSLAGTGRVDPRVIDMLQPVRAVLDEFPGALGLAEAFAPPRELARLYGDERRAGVHLVFDFQFIRVTSKTPLAPWDASYIAAALADSERHLPVDALACYALSNHDVPRVRSRHDVDGHGVERARAAALLQLGIRGVPCIYFGDELGLADTPVDEDARVDPAGRDGSRTPMPWESGAGRGFTTGTPWLPLAEGGPDVRSEVSAEGSTLSIYRRALAIRRAEPALHGGAQRIISGADDLLVLERTSSARPVMVVVNTSMAARTLDVPAHIGTVLLASDAGVRLDVAGQTGSVLLPPLAACWLA